MRSTFKLLFYINRNKVKSDAFLLASVDGVEEVLLARMVG